MAFIISNAWISLDGNDFSPYRLIEQTGLSFSQVTEKGITLLSAGPYRGQPAPYGSAISEAIPSIEDAIIEDQLISLLSDLHSKIGNQLGDFNIESIRVWLLVRYSGDGQHGFEIGPDILRLIGQLGATLCIEYMF